MCVWALGYGQFPQVERGPGYWKLLLAVLSLLPTRSGAVTAPYPPLSPPPPLGGASCSPGAGPLEASVCGLGPPHCPLPGSQAWLFLQGSESRSAAPITAPLTWEGSSGPQQLLGGGSRLRFGSSGPMKPRDRHICTQHAFLQTTESLAEMR